MVTKANISLHAAELIELNEPWDVIISKLKTEIKATLLR